MDLKGWIDPPGGRRTDPESDAWGPKTQTEAEAGGSQGGRDQDSTGTEL